MRDVALKAALVLGFAALAGCTSTGDRCANIETQSNIYTLRRQQAEADALKPQLAQKDRTPMPEPPRPSDVAWSAEHCWHGRARTS